MPSIVQARRPVVLVLPVPGKPDHFPHPADRPIVVADPAKGTKP
ncbi:hypothetical protein [Amycolatopsis plumensis]